MHHRTKLTLAILATSTLLALAAGSTSARSFSLSGRNFQLIWNNTLTGKRKFFFGDNLGHHVECNLTLLGHLAENTIVKRTGINQGTINHGEIEGCVNGTATVRTETMPWTLRYTGFTGLLPVIETIRTSLIGVSLRFSEVGGLSCIFRTEVLHPLPVIVEGVRLENIRVDETITIPLEGVLCGFASPGHFSGRGLIRNLPNTANITVTLI